MRIRAIHVGRAWISWGSPRSILEILKCREVYPIWTILAKVRFDFFEQMHSYYGNPIPRILSGKLKTNTPFLSLGTDKSIMYSWMTSLTTQYFYFHFNVGVYGFLSIFLSASLRGLNFEKGKTTPPSFSCVDINVYAACSRCWVLSDHTSCFMTDINWRIRRNYYTFCWEGIPNGIFHLKLGHFEM